jgi:colanic acid/amylovoran biosynthesis glycosyltransferase
MKILHIAPNAYPFVGGIEVILKFLSRTEREQGLNELVIAFPDRSHVFSGEFEVEGTRILPLKVLKQKQALHFFPKPKYSAIEIVQIFANYRKLITAESPDIIHLHDYSEASMPAISVGKSLGIPIIQHLHSLVDASYPKDLVSNFKTLDNFICVSTAVKESLNSALGYESHADIIANAIPPIATSGVGTLRKENHILMVGRCVTSKGFEFGLDVLQNLRADGISATLELIGDGPSLGTLKAIAKHKGVDGYIHFARLQTREEIFMSMQKASVMLIPSQSQEGFSLVALEAALCELPVVATNIGGLPETVKNGVTGFIVPHDDLPAMTSKVKKLLDDQSLARLMGSAGRSRAQSEYDYSLYVKKLNSMYRKILKIG